MWQPYQGIRAEIVSQYSNIYGNDVILRENHVFTGGRKTWIQHQTPLQAGVLEEFHFYVHDVSSGNDAVPLRLQIWRPAGGFGVYQLVYEMEVTVDHSTSTGVYYIVSTVKTVSKFTHTTIKRNYKTIALQR